MKDSFAEQTKYILDLQEIPFNMFLLGAINNPPEENVKLKMEFEYGNGYELTATKCDRVWKYHGRKIWELL